MSRELELELTFLAKEIPEGIKKHYSDSYY